MDKKNIDQFFDSLSEDVLKEKWNKYDKYSKQETNHEDVYCIACGSCGEAGCCPPTICNGFGGKYCASNLHELRVAWCTLEDFYEWLYSDREHNQNIINKLDEIEERVKIEMNN